MPSLFHQLTNFSLIKFPLPRTFLKTTRFAVSARGPVLWDNFLSKIEKEVDNFLLLKQRAGEKDTHRLDYLCQ